MYLPFDEYKERSIYEPAELDEFFGRPGRVNTYSRWEKSLRSRKIDDKLRRRYVVPFGAIPATAEPDPAKVPEAVKDWLTAYLDARVMRARRDPGAEAEAGDSDNTLEATEATKEIENAANADVPHPELPLRADAANKDGVSRGGPFVISYHDVHDAWDALARGRSQ